MNKKQTNETKVQGTDVSRETNTTNIVVNEQVLQERMNKMQEEHNKNQIIENMIETNEVKKRAKMGRSTIYLLKSFKEHINKLATNKVVTIDELKTLQKIQKDATARWIGLNIDEI